ncbi:MAG: hypothetical protein MRK02_14655 [Candidatus Scalindua sp.]|nr:hypothetical protein [Candidatus Scalindua sp.]
MNTIIIAVSSNMDIAKLNELLKKFDKEKGPLCEIDISAEFKKLYEANDNSDVSIVLQAERMAFDFREDCKNQETGWGTYYGSMFVFRNEDGTFSEGPSIQKITPEIINYWEKRSQQTQHPVLKARYLGLIWDFSEKVSGKKPSHTIALAYIDNLIEIAEKKLQEHEGDIRSKLKRAIELSKSLNRTDRLEKARECVLTYHNSIIRADAPGFWPMAYDLLIENKKAKTTPEQEKVIIDQLEEILTKLEKRDQSVRSSFSTKSSASLSLFKIGNFFFIIFYLLLMHITVFHVGLQKVSSALQDNPLLPLFL